MGLQTSVRTKPAWLVRVAEGVPVPAPGPGHAFYSLAQLRRPRNSATIGATMITDLRQGRLTMADIERRLSIMERLLLLPAFVPPPAPQFLPKSGFINQNITLNGSNFNVGSPQVLFGTVAAHIVGLPTATQIVVQVPPGLTPAGTPVGVTITVTNAGGTDVSDDIFTALPGPAFAASGSQFTPTSGNPGQNVTLNGFNLNVGTPQALFGTVAAATVGTPTNTQMVVQVPAGVVPVGVANVTVKITVNTSSGSVTSDDSFTVNVDLPAPAFAAPPQFLPKSGRAGQTITLNGSNFNVGTPVVKFDDVTAQIRARRRPPRSRSRCRPVWCRPETLPARRTSA